MPRKRGKDSLKTRGPKTDEAAAANMPPPAIAPMKTPSRAEKQRSSKLAKKAPYGGDYDRKRTS